MEVKIEEAKEYSITNTGVVISHKTPENRELKLSYDKYGYTSVLIRTNDGVWVRRRVHRLVAQAFIPNPKNKPQVNHINGVKDDNKIENLEWVTGKENIIHSVQERLHHSGRSIVVSLYYKETCIAKYPSILQCSKVLRLNMNTIANHDYLFDDLLVVREKGRLSSDDPLYMVDFIKHPIKDIKSIPFIFRGKYYQSARYLSEEIGVHKDTIRYKIFNNQLLDGDAFHKVSQYEYVIHD